jgi:outer membrane protein assembly factor BamB
MQKSRTIGKGFVGFIGLVMLAGMLVGLGCAPVPKQYGPPPKTAWEPQGCRLPVSINAILGLPVDFFRTLHADTLNSNDVSIALTPVYAPSWVMEKAFYIAEGPTFDKEGNLYFSPILPAEEVIIVSLDPATGARRWAVPGFSYGGGAPLVLNDPADTGKQIIYLGTYDRALALKPDGTKLWDVPTGLPAAPLPTQDSAFSLYHCFGLNYQTQADALIGITGDGHIYALDRATGAQLLSVPYVIPGEPSPPRPATKLPASILTKADNELRALFRTFPAEMHPLGALTDVLLGYGTKVANYFAVDPHTGYIWIAATAPDAEDGTVDGISEYGALYSLELHLSPGSIAERFHTSFAGGSASSPSLNADGTRVYMGDNIGTLIAIDTTTGNRVWEHNVGQQIIGSVCVAADNRELYAATSSAVTKVIDLGDSCEEVWRSQLDMYQVGVGQSNFNLQVTTAGANGLLFQGGAGPVLNGISLPLKVGVGLLDRETGKISYFADGPEESVSVMSVGPDGAVYIAHSPLRRAFARAIFPWLTQPIIGGVARYAPQHLDFLIRDAICAAAARTRNAYESSGLCPDEAATDMIQIQLLIDQCRYSAPQAIANGDLSAVEWGSLSADIDAAQANLTLEKLDIATGYLEEACAYFPD